MGLIDDPQVAVLGRFLDLAVHRTGLIGANLANIDTPGYRTLDFDFRQQLEQAEGQLRYASWPGGQDSEMASEITPPAALASDPAPSFAPLPRPVRGLMVRPDGNNVSLEREGLLLADTQMRYNLAIELLKDTFHMLSSAIHEGSTS